MKEKKDSVSQYLDNLPEDRKEAMKMLRKTLKDNLPEGFSEVLDNVGIGYVVPHSLYSAGYHCNPDQPLPFITIASQKNFIALYHMGIYADQKLLNWFTTEYPKHSKTKLDMGKSCMRFKKIDQIPYELISELVKKVKPKDWIKIYEAAFKK